MVEAEAAAKEIAELAMQLDILRTLYSRGRADLALRRGLTMRGYGEWTLDNVYAFVYETAIELPSGGHGKFLGEINETDFAGLLAV